MLKLGFTLFPDEDFKNAYDCTTNFKGSSSLEMRDLKYYLTKVFGFPPLDDELASIFKELMILAFRQASEKSENDSITFEEVLKTLYKIRGMLCKEVKNFRIPSRS